MFSQISNRCEWVQVQSPFIDVPLLYISVTLYQYLDDGDVIGIGTSFLCNPTVATISLHPVKWRLSLDHLDPVSNILFMDWVRFISISIVKPPLQKPYLLIISPFIDVYSPFIDPYSPIFNHQRLW